MKITTVGSDLAKDVFQVHAVDASGKTVASKRLRRAQMAEYFARLEPCLIGMEACGSAHYWARNLMGDPFALCTDGDSADEGHLNRTAGVSTEARGLVSGEATRLRGARPAPHSRNRAFR